jgi:hypothetical protein
MVVINERNKQAKVGAPGKPCLMFVSKVKPEPIQEEHIAGTPLWSSLLALPANIILGWKGLPGTHIPA